jgi:hypothetical protein
VGSAHEGWERALCAVRADHPRQPHGLTRSTARSVPARHLSRGRERRRTAQCALLVVAGLDALRSKGNRRSLRTSATAGIVSSTPTEELGGSPAIREYVLRASAICTEAGSDLRHAPFGPVATLEDIAAWDAEAARAAESSLRQLQALPPPDADRALIEQFFSEAAEEIDLLRQSAAAASAGEETHARGLARKTSRCDASKGRKGRPALGALGGR